MRINPIISPHIYLRRKVNSKSNLPSQGVNPYKPSFSSVPIYELNAIKEEAKGIKIKFPVRFSKMDRNSANDYQDMLGIRFNLGEKDVCGIFICKDFAGHPPSMTHNFIIETEERGLPLKDRIIAMAQVDIWNSPKSFVRNMEINYLQSMRNVQTSRFKNIKGGGELCLYGLVKLAQEKELDYINLRSEKDSFYDHIKFGTKEKRADDSTYYTLRNSEFSEFLRRVESKYGLSQR